MIIDDLLFSAAPGEPDPLPDEPGLLVEADDFGFIEAPIVLPPPPPQPPPPPSAQLIVLTPPAPTPLAAQPKVALEAVPMPAISRLDAFAEIEGLDTREKLRRFT